MDTAWLNGSSCDPLIAGPTREPIHLLNNSAPAGNTAAHGLKQLSHANTTGLEHVPVAGVLLGAAFHPKVVKPT